MSNYVPRKTTVCLFSIFFVKVIQGNGIVRTFNSLGPSDGKLIIIGSDNGLSPDRRQAIIWTNAELLSIGPMRTYFSENLIKMQQFSLKKMHVKMSSAKWRLSCLCLNVLTPQYRCNYNTLSLQYIKVYLLRYFAHRSKSFHNVNIFKSSVATLYIDRSLSALHLVYAPKKNQMVQGPVGSPSQMASDTESVSMLWHRHDIYVC